MIRVGICDDNENDRQIIYRYCENFLTKHSMEYECIFFAKGESVLEYCQNKDSEKIHLLFMDIEMPGISGIEVKNNIINENSVWRIVFVSAHRDGVWGSFGLKTIGFELKPIDQSAVEKWIQAVYDDMKESILIEIKHGSENKNEFLGLEDITYFKAQGNYTVLYLRVNSEDDEQKTILMTKKIGELEKEFEKYPIIRVHKSYLVNLLYVTDMEREIIVRNISEKIPIGKSYKESARKRYIEYAKNKVDSYI